MRKTNYFLAALAFACTMALSVSAQTRPKTEVPFKFEKALPGGKKADVKFKEPKPFPLLNQMMLPRQKVSLLREVIDGRTLPTPKFDKGRLEVLPNLELWANILSNNFVGICWFNPTQNIKFNPLGGYDKGYFNAGSGLVEDAEQLHGIYLDTTYSGWGIILVVHIAWDTRTWEMIGEPEVLRDYRVIATETANDPRTGEVFGQFYNADLTSREFGVIDYQTMTRTTIGPSEHQYVAMGVTSEGEAFGVATDGNLYHIDRINGLETLIGSTGVQVARHNGNAYFQSGEIDPRTDEFYWASVDSTGLSMLYTVDLTDGHVTQIGGMGSTNVMALTIPAPKAADGAPDKVRSLSCEFVGASLTGKIKFRAPDETFGGKSLDGELTYKITSNKQDVATGTVQAGDLCETMVTLPEGMNKVAVTVSNNVGPSPKVKKEIFVGYDTPLPAKNVKLKIDAANLATLTWNAPTTGVHNGFLGTLKYDIYKVADGDTTLVAADHSTTTYTETIPSDLLKKYSYAIRVKNEKHESEYVLSNGQSVGTAFKVPFFDDFLTESDAELYTIVDANYDGTTWKWLSGSTNCFFYKHSSISGNDWLITPPIHLKGGKSYKLNFSARAGLANYPERIEVKWGNGNKVANMTNELIAPTDIASIAYQRFGNTFTPTTDGDYYFGFHAISDAETYFLYMDSLSIESAEDSRPAAVTNLKATADPTGALKVNFTFTTPTKTVGGAALSSISKVEIRKGNYIIKTITNPSVGAVITATDEKAKRGLGEYSVVAFNGDEPGERALVKLYVGIDKPEVPLVRVIDQTTSAKITWQPVKGANGGVILPSEVRYDIYNVTDAGAVGEKIGSVQGGTEFLVSGLQNNEGIQDYKQWAVNANTAMGSSLYGVGAIVVGAPYLLPFHNSFKDLTLEGQFFAIERPNKEITWDITNDKTIDNDGGAIAFRPTNPGTAAIVTGKISLQGAKAPKLLFDYYAQPGAKASLGIELVKKDGSSVNFWSCDFSTTAAGEVKWNHVILDLPSEPLGQDYFRVRIRGTANASLEATPIYFDNINVMDPLQRDASISMTTVESVKKGQSINLDVRVTNRGLDNIRGAKLIVTANNKEVYTSTIDQDLMLMQQARIPVAVKTTSLDESQNMNIVARVEMANDLEGNNNTANASVKLIAAKLAAPTDVKAESAGDNKVQLTWKAPYIEANIVKDDFESYDAWSTTFGDWTTIDADHGCAGALSENGSYPHQDEEFAFMNWQPSDVFGGGQGLTPHSGKRAAVAIYQFNRNGTDYVKADNWLISPLLSGKEQTIHFWVNNVKSQTTGRETFDVLASSIDTDTLNFVKIGETHVQESANWTEISVKLPAGTRYFAIHQNTSKDQASIFMIDDVSYETGNILSSYNIYCDKVYRGNTAETSFTDVLSNFDAAHSYSITAVYLDGSESEPVTVQVVNNIETIGRNETAAYNVYTLNGILVRKQSESLRNLRPGIYIINGRKYLVK